MPDWLSWGNVSSCRLLRRHVFKGSDMIGHRSAGVADGVASCLARRVVLGMFERTDVYWRIRTVNVNRRRGWI